MNKTFDYYFKMTIIGDSGTGKSNILKRFSPTLTYEWNNTLKPTIDIDFSIVYSLVDQYTVRLLIWDTSGDPRFRRTVFLRLRGKDCFLIVYDITNRKTFENVTEWIKGVKEYVGSDATTVLMGNKSDLEEDREVSYEEGRLLAEEFGVKLVEVSAKRNENLQWVARWLMKQEIERGIEKEKTQKIPLPDDSQKRKTFSSLTKCFST